MFFNMEHLDDQQKGTTISLQLTEDTKPLCSFQVFKYFFQLQNSLRIWIKNTHPKLTTKANTNNAVLFRLPQPVQQYVAQKGPCADLRGFGTFPSSCLQPGALTSPKAEEFQEAETSSFAIFLENINFHLNFYQMNKQKQLHPTLN